MAYIKLDFAAYKHNLEYLAQKVGDISKIMVVLKDNAYGHGIEQMAPMAAACGVKWAVVKNTSEALKICDFFEKVLVLIESSPENAVVDDKIIYGADELNSLRLFPKDTQIHLKVDTGMRRNGVRISELEEAFKLCEENSLKLQGVFTHFYGADMQGEDFYTQLQTYKKAKSISKTIAEKYGVKLKFHSRNSAASLRIDGDFEDDFIRAGLASYGYEEMEEGLGEYELKPVLSLWAKRFSTRNLKKGEKLGYGGAYEAPKDMVVSSYDLGYGDGLFRTNANRTYKVQNGKTILGRMSMDCFSIEGDDEEVCVFSDAREIAKTYDTIVYDVITKLFPYIKKVVTPYTKS